MPEYRYIGKGLYTLYEAAAFTEVSWARVRHWVRGDLRTELSKGRYRIPSIIKADFGKISGKWALSFMDLMEIRMIFALEGLGVSLHTIRNAHIAAIDLFKTKHPFIERLLWTDGKGIWVRIAENLFDVRFLEVIKRQYELPKVTEMFLEKVDFESDYTIPIRFWPLKREKGIVIDPLRGFGQPITANEGVPTIALAKAVKAEGSFETVAKYFEVSEDLVKESYFFELNYTRRAA